MLNLNDALWRFDTKRYTIAFFALDEDMSPEDSFSDRRDVKFAREGGAHWFCACVALFDKHGDELTADYLGGCSYRSYREFYCGHRWQWQPHGKSGRWITDNKSDAWKRLDHNRPRRADGSRADGWYFPDMVRQVISEGKALELRRQHVAA